MIHKSTISVNYIHEEPCAQSDYLRRKHTIISLHHMMKLTHQSLYILFDCTDDSCVESLLYALMTFNGSSMVLQ